MIKAVTHFAAAWGILSHVAVTAPTGAAAVLIGGCTLHSFAGMSSHGRRAARNVSSAQLAEDPTCAIVLLIIDEVSLVSAEFLGDLSTTLKRKRNDPSPFGGLAVLFCGDFYQLPPVPASASLLTPIAKQTYEHQQGPGDEQHGTERPAENSDSKGIRHECTTRTERGLDQSDFLPGEVSMLGVSAKCSASQERGPFLVDVLHHQVLVALLAGE